MVKPSSGKKFENCCLYTWDTNISFGSEAAIDNSVGPMAAFNLRIQPIDATHSLNFSAGE